MLITISDTNDNPTYENEDYLFVEQVYMKLFDQTVCNIILEHAKDSFTPKKLLDDILIKLRDKSPFLKYTLSDIRPFLTKKQNALINNINYTLYILYCDPLTDLIKLNWSQAKFIICKYFKNKFKDFI